MTKTQEQTNKPALRLSNPWIAVGAMTILVIIIFGGFIFSDQMLFSSDQMSGLDGRAFYKTSIEQHHQFPFWLSPRLGGMPTIDAMFGDALYPPSILISLCTPIERAIGFKMIFHILLAGIFFFLMLRRGFGFPQLIALTGALFYMFNPQFVSHIYPGHDGKMFVIAWLPFVVWRLKALMDTPNLRNLTLLGIGIGMSILTSHIQMTYFVLWGAFLYWLTSAGLTLFKDKNPKRTAATALYFWGAVIAGLAIGAMQLFPSFMYVRDAFSVRGADRGFEFAASWALGWPEFFSLWVPEFVNTLDYYWGVNPFKLNSEYAGMLPLLLATGAVIIKPKNPWRIFWGVVALGTVLFALGANTPVFHIAYAVIPGVKKFRAASMIMFWFSFSTVLLSALFLKDLATGFFSSLDEKLRSRWKKGLLIAGGVCIAAAILFSMQGFTKGLFGSFITDQQKDRIFDANFSRNFVPFLWMWLVCALVVIGLLRGVVTGKVSTLVFTVAVLTIGLIDIVRNDARFIKLVNPAPYVYKDPALRSLADEMRTEPFRCYSLPGTLQQNGEGLQGLEGLGGFHDNELHWYREFRGDQQDRNYLSSLIDVNSDGQMYLRAEKLPEGNPFLNLANARYLLARNGTQVLTIRNNNALGRLSFVAGYEVIDSAATVSALASGTFDYRRSVALTVKPNLPESFPASRIAAETPVSNELPARWEKYTPNYRKAIVTVPATGFVRISEVYYPGWDIRIDGKSVPFYRADLAWMAITAEKGEHTLEMRPRSNYFGTFAPISFGIAGLIALFWVMLGVQKLLQIKGTPKKS
jgi:hypothetical protein